jgi:NAD(P)H-hydrate epimerase
MGQSEEAAELLTSMLNSVTAPTVVDADALNLAATMKLDWKKFSQAIVVTPHPGEMARLTGAPVAEVRENRERIATDYAKSNGITVVLKDSTTVIAGQDGSVIFHHHPCVALATGGTGDLLAGLIGGFLAQGCNPVDAAYAGVVVHSEAGADVEARLGRAGALASDVLAALPQAQERQRLHLEASDV